MSKLTDFLNRTGSFPRIKLRLFPLSSKTNDNIILIDNFLTYSFQSAILIPVDTFSFSFTNPGLEGSFLDFISEGDIIELQVNDQTISTGIIDMIDVECTVDGGEMVNIQGRDLMAQIEDQGAISLQDKPMWANSNTIAATVGQIIKNTKIRGLRLQDAPSGGFLFASEPNENKLSALQRFLEPLNVLAWMDATGNMIVGRPNMAQEPLGELIMERDVRNITNVLSMKATYASTQIPNVIVPIWTGQETVQDRVSPQQRVLNYATGPANLLRKNYVLSRAVVVSTPQGTSPADLSDVNALKVGGANILQAYAQREMARLNVNELIVQCVIPGHLNDDMIPFAVDQVYKIRFPRAKVDEKMYLMSVNYTMDATVGPRTVMSFCKLNRIVAKTSIKTVSTKLLKRNQLG